MRLAGIKFAVFLTLLSLHGCGDSSSTTTTADDATSGEATSDSGSVQIAATGSIDAFGSIYVGGKCYETTDAEIRINSNLSLESELARGMYVRVIGTPGTSEACGQAQTVEYGSFLKGPIARVIDLRGGLYKAITVLGQTIVIGAEQVVFDGLEFDSLAVGDWVEASGPLLRDGLVSATLLVTTSDESSVNVTSTVASISGLSFALTNGPVVNTESATLSDFNGQDLAVDQRVEVIGDLNSDGEISAQRLVLKTGDSQFGSIDLEAAQGFTVEGEISDYNSQGSFIVAGVTVNGETASISPSFLSLAEGLDVELSGDLASGQITASTIYVRRLTEEGSVSQIESTANQLTVTLAQYNGESISVTVNDSTIYANSSDAAAALSLADLNTGDRLFLELEYRQSGEFTANKLTLIPEFFGGTTTDPAAIAEGINANGSLATGEELILDSYQLNASEELELVLNSSERYGRIVVEGDLNFGGDLLVTDLGVLLSDGMAFDLFDGDIQGTFSDITLPVLDAGLSWNCNSIYNTGVISVTGGPDSGNQVNGNGGCTVGE